MHMWIMAGAAYALPRGLSYAYEHIPINQIEGRGSCLYPISVATRYVVNSCIALSAYLPHAAGIFLNFLFASIYDSSWIAIPLFATLVTSCGCLMKIAAILGLSIFIEIARNWVEFAFSTPLPSLLRTNYPVNNTLAHTAFKVIMLFPVLLLVWTVPYMIGRELFSSANEDEEGRLEGLVTTTAIAATITHMLLRDVCNYLRLSIIEITPEPQLVVSVNPRELEPGAICPISHEPISDPVRPLRCPHIFEREFLIQWITYQGQSNRSCPICRGAITPMHSNRFVNWLFQ